MKKLMMAVVAMAAASAAMAGVSFSYQGTLMSADGTAPVSGTKTIAFRLYETPTGTDALWGRKVAVQLNESGLFNVELSATSGSPIDSVKTNDLDYVLSQYPGSLYLGLDVEGSTGEIRPRQKLLSVPTAGFAQDVKEAKRDFTVVGSASVNEAVNVGGSATVGGDLTVGGPINAGKGIKVSGGGLSVSGGGLSVSGGELKLSGGSLTVEANVAITQGGTSAGFVPRGVIVMWSGEKIPQGWALCDGSNGTPDLRDRFIVGAGNAYEVNATGGCEKVALTVQEMPTHYHVYLSDNRLEGYFDGFKNSHPNIGYYALPDNKNGSWLGGASYDWSPDASMRALATGNAGGAAEHGGDWNTAGKIGKAEAHENRPPYYALCFIMKL